MVAAHFGYARGYAGATAPRRRSLRKRPVQPSHPQASEKERFTKALMDREKFRQEKTRKWP
jgi:hypothetical protein